MGSWPGLPEKMEPPIVGDKRASVSTAMRPDLTSTLSPTRCCGPTKQQAASSKQEAAGGGAVPCRVADVRPGEGQRQLTTLKRANTQANTSAVLHLRPRLSSTTQPRVLTVRTPPVPRHVMPWHADDSWHKVWRRTRLRIPRVTARSGREHQLAAARARAGRPLSLLGGVVLLDASQVV